MATLLHLDSSPMGNHSISRNLTNEYVENWKRNNPEGRVIVRDLSTTSIAPLSGAWIVANHTPNDARTAEQKALLALSDELIGELEQADEIVIGVPMHNFNLPAVLKLWIDQVVRAGKTFAYANGATEGLLKGKKADVVLASGFEYGPGSPIASMNFVEPYLRTVLGFVGITDVTFLLAGGASAVAMGKTDAQTFLAPHVESIRAKFQAA